MRRIKIRMLAISYSLLKITWVPASFPRTSFSVPAHAEDAGGLENAPWDLAPMLFVQINVIELWPALSCTSGLATFGLLSDLCLRKLKGDKGSTHTTHCWFYLLNVSFHHCHQLRPSYHHSFLGLSALSTWIEPVLTQSQCNQKNLFQHKAEHIPHHYHDHHHLKPFNGFPLLIW